jgi:hypothetical protein
MRAGGMTQAVEQLLSKYKALSLNNSTTKMQKKEKRTTKAQLFIRPRNE